MKEGYGEKRERRRKKMSTNSIEKEDLHIANCKSEMFIQKIIFSQQGQVERTTIPPVFRKLLDDVMAEWLLL